MDDNAIQSLASRASAVATAEVAHDEAAALALTAEETLLGKIIAVVRPGLRGLVYRVVVWQESSGHATDRARETRTYSDWHGILVAGGREEDYPQANEGAYEGSSLYLTADGTFREIAWGGEWSRWQGSGARIEGTVSAPDIATVAREWNVEEIVRNLEKALTKRLAGLPAKTKASRDRAARFSALASLL